MASQPIWAMRIKGEANGPRAYAYRLSSYIKDAEYIHALTRREYGPKHLPTVEAIRAMQADHERRKERFKALAEAPCLADKYNPDNDNGEAWSPTPILPPKKRIKPSTVRPFMPPKKLKPADWGEGIGRRIIRITAEAFGFTTADLTGRDRRRGVMLARVVAVRLLRNVKWQDGSQRFSTIQIGVMLGGRDHSTILNALSVFGPYRRKYPEVKAAYNLLRRKVSA